MVEGPKKGGGKYFETIIFSQVKILTNTCSTRLNIAGKREIGNVFALMTQGHQNG